MVGPSLPPPWAMIVLNSLFVHAWLFKAIIQGPSHAQEIRQAMLRPSLYKL